MPLSFGTRLGPYEVVALIGEGGMGQVYRATDTRLNRTVALKVLPAGLTDLPDRRERFEREAHAIGALNHPNICTLHDIGRARPQPEGDHGEVDFLVMEHVEGETLADRLTRGERVLFRAPVAGLVADGTWARTPSGDALAIEVGGDIWRWSSHDGTSAAFVATPAVETSPAFSSDGRWLAYASSDAVGSEIWVRPFPTDGSAVQVSAGGGTHPAWGPGNREIFYVNGNAAMSVTVTTSPAIAATSSPRKVFESSAVQWRARGRNYDVDPKTGRFLVLKSLGGPSPSGQLVVVVDWMAGALERMKPRGD